MGDHWLGVAGAAEACVRAVEWVVAVCHLQEGGGEGGGEKIWLLGTSVFSPFLKFQEQRDVKDNCG